MPALAGRTVRIAALPALSASGDRLYSERELGTAVHAGTHIRRREITLDRNLLTDAPELSRIFVHEVFHFAWVRLSNGARAAYGGLIESEWEAKARGELGWSAESRKIWLRGFAGSVTSHPLWREYLCESFCDTAALLYSECPAHSEWTLARKHRERRTAWFQGAWGSRAVPI